MLFRVKRKCKKRADPYLARGHARPAKETRVQELGNPRMCSSGTRSREKPLVSSSVWRKYPLLNVVQPQYQSYAHQIGRKSCETHASACQRERPDVQSTRKMMEDEKRTKNEEVTGGSLSLPCSTVDLEVIPLLTGTSLQTVASFKHTFCRTRHACSRSQTRASHFLSSFFFSVSSYRTVSVVSCGVMLDTFPAHCLPLFSC